MNIYSPRACEYQSIFYKREDNASLSTYTHARDVTLPALSNVQCTRAFYKPGREIFISAHRCAIEISSFNMLCVGMPCACRCRELLQLIGEWLRARTSCCVKCPCRAIMLVLLIALPSVVCGARANCAVGWSFLLSSIVSDLCVGVHCVSITVL